MSELNYHESILIDRLKLDDILEENPSKFMEWAKFPFVFFAFNFIYTDLRDYKDDK